MNNSYRKILHVDLDAFFASVEELDNPMLRTVPLVVGRENPRSIVTTANYIARKYGIHSAMPIAQAKKLCPSLYIVPPHFQKYQKKSREVFHILKTYTSRFEPVSIDEAYLDISHRTESGAAIAREIRSELLEKTGLTASVGISFNKFLAKLASEKNKPNGSFEIRPADVDAILSPLRILQLHGIGKHSAEKLKAFGAEYVSDLLLFSEESLVRLLGKQGEDIYRKIRGIDHSPVETEHTRKSIGNEHTYSQDLHTEEELEEHLWELAHELEDDLRNIQKQAKTLQLKWKTDRFASHTRSVTPTKAIYTHEDIFHLALALAEHIQRPFSLRLLGLTAQQLIAPPLQESLLEEYFS